MKSSEKPFESRPLSAYRSEQEEERDRRLLELALRGDGRAFDQLVQAHWAAVVNYVAGLLDGHGDAAKDVAQDVFVRVWERRVSWEPTGSPRSFLLGIARNLTLNYRKWRAVRARAAGRIRSLLREWQLTATPLEHVEEAEAGAAVQRVLAKLPARRREVFLLVRVQGLSYREVADIMNISPQTVANQMSAALSDLRRLL